MSAAGRALEVERDIDDIRTIGRERDEALLALKQARDAYAELQALDRAEIAALRETLAIEQAAREDALVELSYARSAIAQERSSSTELHRMARVAIDRTRAECRELAARVRELLTQHPVDASARDDERRLICVMLRDDGLDVTAGDIEALCHHDIATVGGIVLRHRGPAGDAL